jgi:hypothetical protein
MTPQQIEDIAWKHVDAWLESKPTETRSLRAHVADAITEALAIRDRHWEAGNATLRHERDVALAALAAHAAPAQPSAPAAAQPPDNTQ